MMTRVRLRIHLLTTAWRNFFRRLAPLCGSCDAVHVRSGWRRMRRRSRGVRLGGARYCRAECLERALLEVLGRAHSVPQSAPTAPHRIPLGLLLLSRQQLTAGQLRMALEAQREAAGRGQSPDLRKIGAW